MVSMAEITEFPFPNLPDETGYKLFPEELENDLSVAFHGTSKERLASIIDSGFRLSQSTGSASFARSSALALRYASGARSPDSPEGVVIAVRFASLQPPGVEDDGHSIIYLRDLKQQPKIIGFCIVPAAYSSLEEFLSCDAWISK
jgi:hypothetical protein